MFGVVLLLEDLNLLDWNSENLVALGLKSAVYIWNSENNKLAQTIPLHSPSSYVSSVSWISTGSCLAVGTSNGEVQLWDIETQKRLRNMLGHMSVVGAISWNQHIVSSGSRLGHIHHHDVRMEEHHTGTLRHKQGICSLKWSPSEKHLASGSSDGLLNIWPYDPGSSKISTPLQSMIHPTAVKAMNWCPWLSDTLAVGGGMSDGHIRIWDTTNGKIRNSTNTNPQDQICSILWLPDTRELITGHGSSRNQVTIWQYPSLLKDNDVYELSTLPRVHKVYTISKNLPDIVGEIARHGGRVLHLALSRDQKRIFSASANETSFIWKYNKILASPSKLGDFMDSQELVNLPSTIKAFRNLPESFQLESEEDGRLKELCMSSKLQLRERDIERQNCIAASMKGVAAKERIPERDQLCTGCLLLRRRSLGFESQNYY
ncbi:unnamed protein product [Ranitomeya imitator]|uniref:CDC20/Fizzy WD40 domain-containing protein n=1 Tax=Ranitomeya imitator TaxID=111125 RepID=A0ABN9LHZ0_9NEOB|nr:unnamed protein product [Ranitomeya imitator]